MAIQRNRARNGERAYHQLDAPGIWRRLIPHGSRAKIGLTSLILATVLGGSALASAGPTRAETTQQQNPVELQNGNQSGTTQGGQLVSLNDVLNNPNQFIDQTVIVRGSIDNVLGPRAMTVAEYQQMSSSQQNALSQNPQDLLVVGALGPAPQDGPAFSDMFDNDMAVQVTGTVHVFNQSAFEHYLGYNLNENLDSQWGGHPAIIADAIAATSPQNQIAVYPSNGTEGANNGSGALSRDQNSSNQIGSPRNNPNEAMNGNLENANNVTTQALTTVVENPSDYYGQMITVTGRVANTDGHQAFVLQGDDLLVPNVQMLVVSSEPLNSNNNNNSISDISNLHNELVTVTGTLHPFDSSRFQQRTGANLDSSQFDNWNGQPALIADSIIVLPTQGGNNP